MIFQAVLDELLSADAYVVAAPAYLLSANASLKKFLDRGLQFYAFVDRLWGKPAVGVAIAGIHGMEGSTKLNVESFIKMTMGDLRGSAVIYGALPGETLLDSRKPRNRRRTGGKPYGPGKFPSAGCPRCPLCGGDTFRFLPGGAVRCMLCSSSGDYEWKEDRLQLAIQPGEHPLLPQPGGCDPACRMASWDERTIHGTKERIKRSDKGLPRSRNMDWREIS